MSKYNREKPEDEFLSMDIKEEDNDPWGTYTNMSFYDLADLICQKNNEIEKLNEELKASKDSLDKAEKANQKLKQKNSALGSDLQQYKMESDSLKQERKRLKEMYDRDIKKLCDKSDALAAVIEAQGNVLKEILKQARENSSSIAKIKITSDQGAIEARASSPQKTIKETPNEKAVPEAKKEKDECEAVPLEKVSEEDKPQGDESDKKEKDDEYTNEWIDEIMGLVK